MGHGAHEEVGEGDPNEEGCGEQQLFPEADRKRIDKEERKSKRMQRKSPGGGGGGGGEMQYDDSVGRGGRGNRLAGR